MSDPACWLARFTDTPCEGALVRCHLLQKQWLRQEYPEGAVWLQDAPVAVSARDLRRDHILYDDSARVMDLATLETHPALWRWGCGGAMGQGGHHGMFDGYKLTVPRAEVPFETRLLISHLQLFPRWERDRRFSETVAA